MFLKVTPILGVGRSIKARKLSLHFIGIFQILERIGPVAYKLALPPNLSQLHDVFHVSQLKKYHLDPSHIIEHEIMQLWENLTFKVELEKIIDVQTKQLRSRDVILVKVVWKGLSKEEARWETERGMKEQHPHLFY